jgi:hypothetical protein
MGAATLGHVRKTKAGGAMSTTMPAQHLTAAYEG